MTLNTLDRIRGHQFITEEIRQALPRLYATEHQAPAEKMVVAKWFSPYTGWRWYVLEFDGTDEAFGFVTSPSCPEGELGYLSLVELETMTLGPVPAVERDCWWTPKPLAQVMDDAAASPHAGYGG